MNNSIVLGTAGHIDHGKTTLVKALTGIDCDRLKEEKERGITIELGFAYLDLPSGVRISIIDVPGHERFIKNMLAGASGIDAVMMVIAADEGVMPQTKEHLEICSLLGIGQGLIVLTKTDKVEPEWLEMIEEDVKEYFKETFLKEAAILKVSATNRNGIDELKNYLFSFSEKLKRKNAPEIFRLPLDRVFSIKGFGTVGTGTIISGRVNTGDAVIILPEGVKSKARGVQVHGKPSETALSGQRTAINFQGVEKDDINRGSVVTHPDVINTTQVLDSHLTVLRSSLKPLKNRVRVKFHTGTSEILALVILLDKNELKQDEEGYAQIILETPSAFLPNDRFVLRNLTPVYTIGGGIILDNHPERHRRFKDEVLSNLKILREGSETDAVKVILLSSKNRALSEPEIYERAPFEKLKDIIGELKKCRIALEVDLRCYYHAENLNQTASAIKKIIELFHQDNPLKHGISKEELRSRLKSKADIKLFNFILAWMEKENHISLEGENVRLKTFSMSLRSEEKLLKERIAGILEKEKFSPPTVKEMLETLKIKEPVLKNIIAILIKEGITVKVKDDIYYSYQAIEELKERLSGFLSEKKEITPADFRDLTGLSRKYIIPLLEYFDSVKLTVRLGDKRVLRNRNI